MEQSRGFTIGGWVSDGKRIGKGAFATVYLGHHKDDPSELVAIKVVDVDRLTRSNQKLKRHLDSEISIMKSLQHDHIVTLHEVFVEAEYIYLILEYCVGGDFSDYLKKHKRLSEDTARSFLRQLASGLKYLHSRNIVHRDLKPQNLLMAAKPGRLGGDNGDDSTRWELKIADFGFARFMEPQSVASTLCGSPLYMARPSSHLQLTARHHNTQHGTISRHPVQLLFAKAPEVLLCQPYDAKADLWSVGAILFEMLTGSPPFNVRTHIELVRILVSEQVKFPRNLGVSSDCMDLLQALLKKNKEERITWREFFSHPFIVHDTAALTAFKTSTSRAIPISHSGSHGGHRKRSATIGSAPTNVGYTLPPSPPMAVGSPICASLPPHRMESNFISPPRSMPHAIPSSNHYYHPSFLTPSSLPHNISSSPLDRGGGFLVGSGPGYSSPPQFATSPPAFAGSPSSPGSVMHIRTAGAGSGDLNSPPYLRSPNSSGGFGEGFGSGWGSGPRKPLTNPFKESFDLSPFPSTTIDPKEKESAGSSGDDSFELLESESSTSKSTYTTPEERRIVDALELMVRKTAVVIELADSKVDESPIDALALYIKALHIYHSISHYAKKSAQSHNLTASKRLGLVVERMRSEFKATLKKAEYLKRNLKPNDSCPPAEKSIYESALQMGRDGAVAEVLHNFSKAESLYVRSSQLLQLLTMDASHPSDKAVLESYIASFEKRLGEVRKSQAKLDDHVEDSLNVGND